MKPPIWVRQGRPKPPKAGTWHSADYAHQHARPIVFRSLSGNWWVYSSSRPYKPFPTHAEAIAWADYHARKETP